MMRLLSTRTCAVLVAGSVVAAAVSAIRPLLSWDEHRLPTHWSDRIGGASDSAASAMVRGLVPSSTAAVRALVDLAASPRAVVAQAAQARLDEWMFSVERRRVAAGRGSEAPDGELCRALSSELARNSDRFGPVGGRWARQTCRRLLDMVDALPLNQRVGLIQECEAVLTAVEDSAWGSASAVSRQDFATSNDNDHPSRFESAADEMLRFAMRSGPPALDPTSAMAASAGRATGEPPSVEPPRGDPREAGAGPVRIAEDDVLSELGLPTASGPGLAWRSRKETVYGRLAPQAVANGETLDVPSPEASQALEDELLHAPLAAVLNALASEDPFRSASADAVLRTRGMSDVDLQVARNLAAAGVEARLALLDEVSRRSGANTSAWLHHFAQDESAEVRLRALTLLGTSRDDSVLRQVHARALGDEDPRIRALARRLAPAAAEAR